MHCLSLKAYKIRQHSKRIGKLILELNELSIHIIHAARMVFENYYFDTYPIDLSVNKSVVTAVSNFYTNKK